MGLHTILDNYDNRSRYIGVYDKRKQCTNLSHQYEKSAQSDPKWFWGVKGERLSINISSVTTSQISLYFISWPAVFGIQAIYRQVYQMTTMWPWTLPRQRYPICLKSTHLVPNFNQIWSMDSTGHSETSVLNDANITLTLRGQGHPHVSYPTITFESQISFWSTVSFFGLQAILR